MLSIVSSANGISNAETVLTRGTILNAINRNSIISTADKIGRRESFSFRTPVMLQNHMFGTRRIASPAATTGMETNTETTC